MASIDYQDKYGFVIVESKILQHHTFFESKADNAEIQKLVVGTEMMPKEEWIRTKVFCWMTSLLYFDKLLQIPFIILNRVCGISYRELAEIFMNVAVKYKTINSILNLCTKKASDIQKGKPEHVGSKKWLNIWWPVDELLFIKLCSSGLIYKFYEEAEDIIANYMGEKFLNFSKKLLGDSILLNSKMIKLPFIDTDINITLNYNIPEIVNGILSGITIPLQEGYFCYRIDRTTNKWTTLESWLKEVVWYGTKKGLYLYDYNRIEK